MPHDATFAERYPELAAADLRNRLSDLAEPIPALYADAVARGYYADQRPANPLTNTSELRALTICDADLCSSCYSRVEYKRALAITRKLNCAEITILFLAAFLAIPAYLLLTH